MLEIMLNLANFRDREVQLRCGRHCTGGASAPYVLEQIPCMSRGELWVGRDSHNRNVALRLCGTPAWARKLLQS